MAVTARSVLSLTLAGLAVLVSSLVVGFEIAYWRLLPATPPEPRPLPPLARTALWAELGGCENTRFPLSFPFLAPQIAAMMLEAGFDTPRRSPNGHLLAQLAKTQLFLLRDEGKTSPTLRHSAFALRELAIATWISRHWSPTQAIDAYGAIAHMGENRRGLRAGAAHYFGRRLESLDVGEMALLVAITRYPSRLDPACFPERATAARNDLLARMVETGALDADAAARAAAAPLAVKLDCNGNLTHGL
jgi:hypothetical protein